MSSFLPALLLFLGPVSALAQTDAVRHFDYSRGATLPPTSAALLDDATTLVLNPASLSYIGQTQALYLHERSFNRDHVNDGLFLGDTFFETVGAGFGLEWLRSPTDPDFRKTTWGVSIGAPELSLGTALKIYSSDESRDLDGLVTFDLGATVRPARFLSLAVVARNVDAPRSGLVAFEREFDFGLGLRPFGEPISLGVDYRCNNLPPGQGEGRSTYSLNVEPLGGVLFGAGVSHGFRRGEDVLLQFSLTLNASHLGLTYAAGSGPGGLDHTVVARASVDKLSSVTQWAGRIAVIDLSEVLEKSGSASRALLGLSTPDPYLVTTALLDEAAKDPQLAGVVLKIDDLPGTGLGKVLELRGAIYRLRAAGKKVVAVLVRVEDPEYLLATAADTIYAVPQAMILVNGFAASATFLGTTMEKLGVAWNVARVGAYKNAPDALTRSDMSAEQKETIDALLDTDVRQFEAEVSQARHLSPEQIRQATREALLTPKRAKALGLVDDVVGPEELEARLGQLLPGTRFDPSYRPLELRNRRWGRHSKIALVPVVGSIVGGKSRENPLGFAQVAGSETVVAALKRAAEDSSVAAIVIRVDSGGGDALASDLMYRAVLEAKQKKPVIASMGDVAASGGYLAAMGADTIYASPTTVTGSIGVFMLKPALKGLAEKLGIHHETVKRGELSNLLQLFDPWSPAEQEAAQKWVDAFYDDFISQVAEARKLPKERVDEIARGRVWSGEDAKSRGLVDQLGGLLDAVQEARRRAHLFERDDVELEVFEEPPGFWASVASKNAGVQALAPKSPPALPAEWVKAAREVGVDQVLLLEPGLKAMLPFHLEVR